MPASRPLPGCSSSRAPSVRKYVLDTNCYIDASRATAAHRALETLASLRDSDGLPLAQTSRGFAFDVLLAFTCREHGATLVSANAKDMARIRRVFAFESIAPYPRAPN